MLAKETVAFSPSITARRRMRPRRSRSRRSTWRRSCPLAQALDTFSVVYLQWLSNDVIWRARETVVKQPHEDARAVVELRPR